MGGQFKPGGFSLIELIMIIVILSIAATALIPLFGRLGTSLTINQDIQNAAQMAQECADYLVGARRIYGYGMNGVVSCNALPFFAGNAPAVVNVTDPYGGGACPGTCKLYEVSAAYGGGTAKLNMLFVQY
jgi:type II secretory pathway pseudopilin PulG